MAERNIVYVADYEGGKYLEVERREGENGEFPRVAAVFKTPFSPVSCFP